MTAKRKLRFFAYALGEVSNGGQPTRIADTQYGIVEKFREWGFPVNPLMKRFTSAQQLLEHYNEIGVARPDLDYDIDGVVYKVDRLDLQENWASARAARAGRPRINSRPSRHSRRLRTLKFRWDVPAP